MRLFFLIYTFDLTKTFSLHTSKWLVLVFIFGGWAMIFLNVAIIFKITPEEISDKRSLNAPAIFSFVPNDEIKISTEFDKNNQNFEKESFINCPACLKSLNGTNKCVDCDLEFD